MKNIDVNKIVELSKGKIDLSYLEFFKNEFIKRSEKKVELNEVEEYFEKIYISQDYNYRNKMLEIIKNWVLEEKINSYQLARLFLFIKDIDKEFLSEEKRDLIFNKTFGHLKNNIHKIKDLEYLDYRILESDSLENMIEFYFINENGKIQQQLIIKGLLNLFEQESNLDLLNELKKLKDNSYYVLFTKEEKFYFDILFNEINKFKEWEYYIYLYKKVAYYLNSLGNELNITLNYPELDLVKKVFIKYVLGEECAIEFKYIEFQRIEVYQTLIYCIEKHQGIVDIKIPSRKKVDSFISLLK